MASIIPRDYRIWLWALLFGLAFTQAPLYFSNQHQYFVHGLADGGWGYLADDWLAQTVDPTPAFSAMVAFCFRYIGPVSFYFLFFALVVVYFLGLFRLGCDLLPEANSPARFWFWLLLLVVHAGLVRVASVRILGVDYPWFLQAGIAGQYLLGSYLQPSSFGAFFLFSLVAFARGRFYWACLFCCLPALLHSTYLLPAAMLTIGFQTSLCVAQRWKLALFLGLGNLVLVSPAVAYAAYHFWPTNVQEFEEAQKILAEFRIPHHAVIARWFDTVVEIQIAWMLLGLAALWKTRYFTTLAVVFLIGSGLTLLQYFTANISLALLFPWRISALLVPVATAAILARSVGWLSKWLNNNPKRKRGESSDLADASGYNSSARLNSNSKRKRGESSDLADASGYNSSASFNNNPKRKRGESSDLADASGYYWPSAIAYAMALLLAAGTYVIPRFEWGYIQPKQERAVLEFVRETGRKGDLYLIPTKVPQPGKGATGNKSNTFTPPPGADQAHLIAFDLQPFRLSTGIPIYVDFKAVPYKDVELIAWKERGMRTEDWDRRKDFGSPAWISDLRAAGITHVLVEARHQTAPIGHLKPIYEDEAYRIYRLSDPPEGGNLPPAR